jgi:spermidine/putrescine transport system permease protein
LDSWRDNRGAFWTFAAPGMVWLVLFFVLPLGVLWLYSFGEKSGITEVAVTGTLDNYIRSFDPLYLSVLWKSIWVSALATLACLVLAYPIAFGICFAPPKWKPLLLLLIVLPFWINLLIRTYALMAVLRTQGYANMALGWIGLGPFSMLNNLGSVIFGLIYVFMPFMVLPLYATIERLDRSYLEASLDLGASQSTTFWKVTVPLTMPGIVTGIILVFIPCLGSFLTPELLGGTNDQMIGNVIQRQFGAANNEPFGSALSFLLMYATFGALAIRSFLANRSRGVGV